MKRTHKMKTKTEKSGWIITTERITKTNEGNVPAIADIKIQRDTFSSIFTTFNVAPERVERQGLIVTYSWAAEVLPAGKLEIAAKTNYLYLTYNGSKDDISCQEKEEHGKKKHLLNEISHKSSSEQRVFKKIVL